MDFYHLTPERCAWEEDGSSVERENDSFAIPLSLVSGGGGPSPKKLLTILQVVGGGM